MSMVTVGGGPGRSGESMTVTRDLIIDIDSCKNTMLIYLNGC